MIFFVSYNILEFIQLWVVLGVENDYPVFWLTNTVFAVDLGPQVVLIPF